MYWTTTTARRSIGLLLLIASIGSAITARVAVAQSRGLRVYISVDMEGVAGIVELAQLHKGEPDYPDARALMTGETNAAIAAAFDAGATEVVVNDSHGTHTNLSPEQVDPRALLIRGAPAPFGMVVGLDSTFDAVVLVGYHARASTGTAVIAHTYALNIRRITLNGTEVGEFGMSAAVAGAYGVPVVFVSGDQTLAKEAKALVPAVEAVAVKQAIGQTIAESVHPSVARARIADGVKAGLARRAKIAPLRTTAPVQLDMEVANPGIADLLAFIPGSKRIDGLTVRYTAPTMLQAYVVSRLMATLTRQ